MFKFGMIEDASAEKVAMMETPLAGHPDKMAAALGAQRKEEIDNDKVLST